MEVCISVHRTRQEDQERVPSGNKGSKVYSEKLLNHKRSKGHNCRALEVSSSGKTSSASIDVNGSSWKNDLCRRHMDSGAHSHRSDRCLYWWV